MADDVLLNKAATIERCLRRIEEDYRGHEEELEKNFTRQDAIVAFGLPRLPAKLSP